ncbi:UDP-N-acetylmuramoyl-L-alanine--D-glutamate ligase [Actinopolymorpha singaporensis]|uniref:UDP-N-acetylmuramoylalanine--D-glutamate ligase n=1 Tax=Actinopolymorpha singaporensis TaxID=117157 RepID=A0A1H1X6P9_9ACTN|nr:UDP-N-acetylmuramoyl-L-alanine--D-glutamate ligase [Actinopolymorpha singaporensis]SDT04286.1 UDP-N-acetylmuramoylalanine--D-glutamate ligase [Actinopolymorpha singaporensis]
MSTPDAPNAQNAPHAGPDWLDTADRHSPWPQLSALVTGIGVSGYSAAAGLLGVGARVAVVDERDGDAERERATILQTLGADVRLGPGSTASIPDSIPGGPDVVVTSPGWRPDAPILAQAAAAGIPILGEVDLALRLRDPEHAAPWLTLTGTNGKTTTVGMLASILSAAGLRTAAVGNIGAPVVDAVLDPEPYDVLAVELSSFQLHWSRRLWPRAAAVLNVAPDHLDWHGTLDRYAADKGKIYEGCEIACVYNVADAATEELVRAADVVEGCRAVGFTAGIPAVGMLGVVDGVLADRAFVEQRQTSAAELCNVRDLPSSAPHNVANALAAAALARAHGVRPAAVRAGLTSFTLEPHRIQRVADVDGIPYVDDSKATNAHAALASLLSYDSVVWIAGGLAKGQDFDDLVHAVKGRLRAVVLLGRDRRLIFEALSRHAPEVPVVEVADGETEVMDRVVAHARHLARPGDTVLLAPGCASFDLFASYGARGDAFGAAARRLAGGAPHSS